MSYFSVGIDDFVGPPAPTVPTAAERCAGGDYAACMTAAWEAAKTTVVQAGTQYAQQKGQEVLDKYASPPPSPPQTPDQMLNTSVGAKPGGRFGLGARTQALLAGRGIAGVKKPVVTSQLKQVSTSQVKAVQAASKNVALPAVAGAALLWLLLA